MHELPLCEAVLDSVREQAGGRSVRRIRVRIGTTHHATTEAFQQLFSQAAAGTVAADAVVELEPVPPTFSCPCGALGELADRITLCPSCDLAVRPEGGDELTVTGVEFAAPG